MTLEIIRRYPVKLYQIEEKDFNHGLTRNYGISKSSSKFIILLNHDAIPYNNNWMKKMIDNFKNDKGLAGAYSRHLPHADASIVTKVRVNRIFTSSGNRRESRINRIEDYNKLTPKEKHCFCNFESVSSCLRRDVWEKIPFPKSDFAEDLRWSKSVIAAGYKIVYEPDSVVYHSHDFSVKEWCDKNRINAEELYSLFGIRTIDSYLKILLFSLAYSLRDMYRMFKEKQRLKHLITSICLIPIFAVSGAIGQYKGIKGCPRESV